MSPTEKRTLELTVCALALGLVVWILFRTVGPAREHDVVAPGASGVRETGPDGPLEDSGVARTVSRARAAEHADERGLQRTLPGFAESSGVRIVVLADRTRVPLAGAKVHVRADPSGSRSVLNLDPDQTWVGPDFESYVEDGGLALVTDVNGEVELPAPAQACDVIARFEDQFGWARLDAGEIGLVELALIRPHDVVVRVVDPRGDPQASVGVAFGHCDGDAAFWRMPTDARGEVRIRAIEVLMEAAGIGPLTAFSLRLDVPDLPRIERWLFVRDLTGAPIELTLPATGSLRVQLVDEQGQTVPLSGRATLEPEWADLGGRARIDEPGATHVDFVDGLAFFPRVGLERRFQLTMEIHGAVELSRTVSGPRVASECTTVAVPLDADYATVRGRLVDERGGPLSGRRFTWHSTFLGEGSSIESVSRVVLTTDHEGRFVRMAPRVPNSESPPTERVDFLLTSGPQETRRQARVLLPIEIADAHVDLGDVAMTHAAPSLAGQVRDSLDRPVALAFVSVRIRSLESYRPIDLYDGVTTGPDGAFAMFGPCTTIPLGLDARYGPILEPVTVPVTCPSAGILLRVAATGGLEGTALVDPGAKLDTLVIEFTHDESSPSRAEDLSWRRVGDRLYFQLASERPGIGTVRFASGATGTTASVEVRGVIVPEGRVDRPRALVDVDLRGKFPTASTSAVTPDEAVEFTVVDPGGRSIPRGLISGRLPDGDLQFQRTFGGGRALVPRDEVLKCVSIEVWASGCRASVITPPFAATRITLLPEFAVEFQLAWPAKWRSAGLELVGDVTAVDTDPPQFQPAAFARMQPFHFDERGRGRAHLMMSGRFSIYTTLVREDLTGEDELDYGIGLVQHEFTVRETDGVQVVELTLDPAAVAQCNQDLGLE